MGIKDFFKNRLGFGDKEIEIKQPSPEIPETVELEMEDPSYAKATEGREVDERATRRRLFESKMLRIISLGIGLELAGAPRHVGMEQPPAIIEIEQEQAELQKKLGPQFEEFLFEMKQYEVQKENASEHLSMEVGNFEAVDVPNEEIKNFLYKGYPEEWLAHISGVNFVPFDLDMPEVYGIKETKGLGKPHMVAYVEHRGQLGGSTVVFSKELKNFFSSVSHELGHANDWLARTDLSNANRIALLYHVIGRVQSPDRFQSAYVESIKNPDQYEELQLKATEYWAEIVQAYFDDPADAAKRLPAADYNLIQQFLGMVAPHSDLKQAALERHVRAQVIKQEVIEKKIKTILAEHKKTYTSFGLLDEVKKAATAASRVGSTSIPTLIEQIEAADEAERDMILTEAFSHGNKKWIMPTTAFMGALEEKNKLVRFYKEGNIDACERDDVRDAVESYLDKTESLETSLEKFSPAEQKKIREFHKYLENALAEANIPPDIMLPQVYSP